MAGLSLRNICKIYPARGKPKRKMFGKKKAEAAEAPKNFVAVNNFSMEIQDGEFIVFVGPSGCGKSTTLRMIAGLEEISDGELYIGDKFMNYVLPKDRDIAMVFQNYALYPHMTAYENIAFGLKIRKIRKEKTDENGNVITAIDVKAVREQEKRLKKIDKLLGSVTDEALKEDLLREKDKTQQRLEYFKITPQPVCYYEHVPKETIEQKVAWAAKILGVEKLLDRKPKEMSGGQRQRIALGRAMVRDPKVFLLDEPLSNLDAKLRTSMRSEIVKLHDELKTTFIYVTHDQVEAMTMGTRIVVMKDGEIQQIDTPTNLFDNPVNKFVAGFIGTPQMNFFNVCVKKQKENLEITFSNGNAVKLSLDKMREIDETYLDGELHESILGVRGEHIMFGSDGVEAEVNITEVLGSTTQVYINLQGEENTFVACLNKRDNYRHGNKIKFTFAPENVHLFDKETERTMVGKLK